jgi:amino acid adenylation domain-containing protein
MFRPVSIPYLDFHFDDLIARLAEVTIRRQDHIAVEAPDGRLTYGDLDRVSNQLAQQLRALGVTREYRVGISLPRGACELVALLATLKAGGAYVPLDPSNPVDRLRIMIEDATPQVLIAGSHSPLTGSHGCSLVVLDDLSQAGVGFPAIWQPEPAQAEQLMYVLFTSGSTGRPKGVEITRGAFANFIESMAHTPGMGEDERLLAITTTCFDIAGLELFLPLYVGATVVIADRETARDPQRLRRRLEEDEISMMQATPASWRLLLEAGWAGNNKLRLLCGGDVMSSALAERLQGAGRELWNLYGPTETTVWSSLARIERKGERVTIGRPIDRTTLYVLDDDGQPLAIDEEGEIAIGGAGLARGYLGRPDLTEKRFVVIPSGERVYRTGDLGRQRTDGNFECLGRLDHQVKISGFRIELGEIEAVLRSVPDVREVLVVADSQDQPEPRLVAYFTGPAKQSALVAVARKRLPAYMVPSAYVALEVFPLNANGKIDRKQLPRAMRASPAAAKPAHNDLETRIAALWGDTLGLAQVGVDQNFFDVGGTSWQAIETVAAMSQELGSEVPLQLLYEAPTVEKLAVRLGQAFSPDVPIVVRLRDGVVGTEPIFCLLGVTLYRDLALSLEGDKPVIAMHVPTRYVPGRNDPPTIEQVARRYVDLIRQHQAHGPYYLLGLCFGGIVAYEAAHQLQVEGETVALVAVLDAILPGGFQTDRIDQIRRYLAYARENPLRILSWVRKNIIRALNYFKSRLSTGADQPVDLPVDGPVSDRLVKRFAAHPKRLRSRLLIVRANEADVIPPWVKVRSDLGWAGRADHVIEHQIAAHHIQILREPHVHSLTRALERELKR